MNEELFAASVLFVQSGTLINQSQMVLSTVLPSLQCTSRPPSYFNNTGGTSKGIMTTILPLSREITRTKAYQQSVSLYCATNIIKPICVGIYRKKYF
jgi:hypothetical protein